MSEVKHVYAEMFTSDVQLDDITLSVDYTFEESEEGERESGTGLLLTPDLPALFDVECVFHEGYDITDLLNEDTFEQIHQALLEMHEHSVAVAQEEHILDQQEGR
jgi:hypothetical protein